MASRTLALAVLALAGCGLATREPVAQLAAYKDSATPVERVAGLTGETITCDAVDPVCFQLHAARARACAGLAAAGGPSGDVLRGCAVQEWRLAGARLGVDASDADRVSALTGEAEALKSLRDHSDGAGAAEHQAALRAVAKRLAAVPSGADAAAYVSADADVFAVLAGEAPPAEACARLDDAVRGLARLSARSDFAARAAALRLAVSSARTSGGRSCR
jgi:hypothetical protein